MDVRDGLRLLEPQSIHMVATSPPYWGLRDYGTAQWEGGDAACEHTVRSASAMEGSRKTSTLGGGKSTVGHAKEGYKHTCGRCGARRVDQQLGMESTPDLYVESLVGVFREVRRVLRDDGAVWLNLGDSFSGQDAAGVKAKDLVGVPWRVALALQADGWWLRNAIIWHKLNPMPSPVQDRLSVTYEQVFLLTKSARYFFDLDAIRVPHTFGTYDAEGDFTPGQTWNEDPDVARKMDQTEGQLGTMAGPPRKFGRGQYNPGGKNPGDMWSLPTQPFPGAHFAVWPQAIPERCIRAGTSEYGVCSKCGAPWRRADPWEPSCTCKKAEVRRSVVLDPFSGSGTTGRVALRLGRDYVGIDLNESYLPMAVARLRDDPVPDGPAAPPEGSVLDIFSSEES